MAKLTALTVKNAKPGRHADGHGLYLLVKPTGAKIWLLRVQVEGKRRDIGLGTVDVSPRAAGKGEVSSIVIPILPRKILSLAEGGDKAAMRRVAVKSGLDPIAERDRERTKIPKFREAAKLAHAAVREGLSLVLVRQLKDAPVRAVDVDRRNNLLEQNHPAVCQRAPIRLEAKLLRNLHLLSGIEEMEKQAGARMFFVPCPLASTLG